MYLQQEITCRAVFFLPRSLSALIHFIPATESEDISLMHVLMYVYNRPAGYMQDGLHWKLQC
jgi:hypothetical protein